MAAEPARAEAVFLAAVAIDGAEDRERYLDDACGGDAALRRRVELLLRAHDQPDSLLDQPVLAPAGTAAAATQSFEDRPADGDTLTHGGSDDDPLTFLAPPQRPGSLGRIGQYDVLEVLGRGGFGIVFRAFDDALQRVVAVKALAPSLATTSPARKRFLREARSSAGVRHENVVQVHAVHEQPLPHIVMEFIPGETLQQRLDRSGPLELADVLQIGRQIADGLAAAHAQGLIHRDIKPSNILVDAGPQAIVKITDFGLARAADDASLTRSGTVAGTPLYMAPEQAKGEKIDARADLFSLGSVLYVLCTGRPPFRANSTFAVLKRVAEDTPRPIREVIPEVPEWYCRVVAKLHAKAPDDRFESAREVADLLADCAAQVKEHGELRDFSRIPGGKPTASGWSRRRVRWVGGLLAAAALTYLALWFAAYREATQPPPAPAIETPADQQNSRGTFVNPAGDGVLKHLELGFIALGVPGTNPHTLNPMPGFNLNAPRLVKEYDGDFRFSAEITSFDAAPAGSGHRENVSYRAAGLLVWQDDGNFLRFERATWAEREAGKPFLHAEGFAAAAQVADQVEWVPGLEENVHLQVERRGAKFALRSGKDGLKWADWRTVESLQFGRKLHVGLVVINSARKDFVAGFRNPFGESLPPSSAVLQVPSADGFVPLFNGRDLTGWKPIGGTPSTWKVEGEAIRAAGSEGYLVGDRAFADFQLKAEVRLAPGGKWGIHSHADPAGIAVGKTPRGPGFELTYKGPTNDVAGHLRMEIKLTRDGLPLAINEINLKPNDWLPLDIVVRGNRIDITIKDGSLGAIDKAFPPTPGPIALHLGKGDSAVEFRRIEIRVLTPEPAPDAKNAGVVAALRAAVAAQEKLAATARVRAEVGALSALELAAAEIELTEARVKLAEAEGAAAAAVGHLEKLVSLRRDERKLVRVRVSAGQDTADALTRTDVRVADAEARLAAARTKAP